MDKHAVLETDQAIPEVKRMEIRAHFAAHGVDALILPPGVRVAVMADDNQPIKLEDED